MNKPIEIHIGYDPKEAIAHHTCCYSIKQRSSLVPKKLYSKDIPEYNRNFPNEIQTTDFTFTRFLVPMLMDYKGIGIFVDSDFLFLKDPLLLLKDVNIHDPNIAVWVVKHPQYVPKSSKKMNNLPQHSMFRKNWASLMVFNNEHPIIKGSLTSNFVNTNPRGRDLHEFLWVEDEFIGEIPLEWNTLDTYYYLKDPHAIHYTDGGPWHGYRDTHYAHLWDKEYSEMCKSDPEFIRDIPEFRMVT